MMNARYFTAAPLRVVVSAILLMIGGAFFCSAQMMGVWMAGFGSKVMYVVLISFCRRSV